MDKLEEIIERVVKEILPPRPDLPEFMSGTAVMAWNKAQDETERVIKAACRRAVREALELATWRTRGSLTVEEAVKNLCALAATLEDKT